MGGHILPPILDELPIKVKQLYFKLDGTFPNHEPNPLKAENMRDLQEAVKKYGADVGIAMDGDGDRCAFVDERGEIVPCDLVTALIAKGILAAQKGGVVVFDVRSSWAVEEEIRKAGGIPCKERVGHAFIKDTMRKRNAVFGGELSGHYYFRDNYYADSGVIAMVHVLSILSRERRPMSELLKPLKRYHATGEINFEVEDKEAKLKEIEDAFKDGKIIRIDGITVEYDDWWFNVRLSNTEPLLRLNLEAKTKSLRDKARKRVQNVILS